MYKALRADAWIFIYMLIVNVPALDVAIRVTKLDSYRTHYGKKTYDRSSYASLSELVRALCV